MKSVYCAVRIGSLNKAVCASSLRSNAEYMKISVITQQLKEDLFFAHSAVSILIILTAQYPKH